MGTRETARGTRKTVRGPRPGPAAPQCAICGPSGRGPCTQQHLTHGVSVWLCAVHGRNTFLQRRGGKDFAERLSAVWVASGASSARRIAALQAHVRRIRNAGVRPLQPGSYSWPKLRQEAERRFATGECPRSVIIAELRQTYRDGPAMVPSVRTMRRWFTEARWLGTTQPPKTRQARRSLRIPSKYLRPGVGTLPRGGMQNPFFPGSIHGRTILDRQRPTVRSIRCALWQGHSASRHERRGPSTSMPRSEALP